MDRSRPRHKTTCVEEVEKGMNSIFRKAIANPVFMRYLETILVYHFDLDKDLPENTRRALSHEMLHVRLDIGVEPRDIQDTISLFDKLDN